MSHPFGLNPGGAWATKVADSVKELRGLFAGNAQLERIRFDTDNRSDSPGLRGPARRSASPFQCSLAERHA